MFTKENGFTLPVNFKFSESPKYLFTFTALFIILILIYSNSFYGEWHFDDFANIVENHYIHIKSFSWTEIKHCLYGFDQGRPSRPLSYLSFAVNYKIHGTNVFGYHVVNFGIHYLSAVFLFLFIYNTLKLPLLRGKYFPIAYPVALLATFFWATNPVFVTSITYIVQRMAAMAAMFYIMSMYFYLKARTDPHRNSSMIFFLVSALCGLAAILTKENAAMLPVSILLYDLFLIKGLNKNNIKKYFKIAFLPLIIVLLAGIIYVDFSGILKDFQIRDFTMLQRVLTEPRVILFYLSLLFYPISSRLTLLYDIDISRSLFHPWTTMPSILLIVFIIGFAFYLARKRPLISFCIIFYFLNHLIEGSIFSLELIFEHRNYLPSAFIFFPFAMAAVKGLRYYQRMQRRAMFLTCFALMAIFIAVLGMTTHLRNRAWASEKTLWEDAMLKAPLSARPFVALAWHYERIGQYDKSLNLYEASLLKQRAKPSAAASTLEHMAGIYAAHQDYEKALELYDRSIATDPLCIESLYGKARVLTTLGKWDQAKEIMVSLASQGKSTWNELNLMGFIMLKQNYFEDALEYFRRANLLSSQNPMIFINIGVTLSKMGQYQKASWFLKQANQLAKENIMPLLFLMDNHIKTGNRDAINADVDELLKNFNIEYILGTLQQRDTNHSLPSISSKAISSFIAENLRFRSDALLQME